MESQVSWLTIGILNRNEASHLFLIKKPQSVENYWKNCYSSSRTYRKDVMAITAKSIRFRRLLTFLLILAFFTVLLLPVSAAQISGAPITLWSCGSDDTAAPKILTYESNGSVYLIMPSTADPSKLPLWFSASDGSSTLSVRGSLSKVSISSGDIIDLTALCGKQTEYVLSLSGKSVSMELTVCFSAQIAAMYLTSDDPENNGRVWVESSPDKSNKATGSMLLQNADGSVVYDGSLTQIKGRGNSTWKGAKKPYQIKLSKKTDLLETGNSSNANKTWVLLSNYFDPTMLRNTITYDLAAAMGMETYMENRFVDLYYDGEYRGTYLLCEKVDVDPGRVEITNLEDANEDANADVDLEQLARGEAVTANGAAYHFCYDMTSPDNISGGYLLELDYSVRAMEEACYFRTRRGYYVVVKNPEFCSREEMDYIASLYQEIEDTIFNAGTNPTTGKTLSEYMDMESVAQCYLINELSKNPDGFHTSAYMYKDADSDMMYMGPVWDYDLSYGIGNKNLYTICQKPDGWFTAVVTLTSNLYQIPEFRETVNDVYASAMKPLLENVLLGDVDAVSDDGRLHSLYYYESLTDDSRLCNSLIWSLFSYNGAYNTGRTYAENLEFLEKYLSDRVVWLNENLPGWLNDPCPPLPIYLDVPTDSWFAEAVESVTAAGYMVGFGDGTFLPNQTLTRAQTAQVLYNIGGRQAYTNPPAFTDINPLSWYSPALAWCCENGIVNGYPDNTFKPDASISRQDVVSLLYRFKGSPQVNGHEAESFSDYGSVSGYAADAMEWAVENGIISGYTDNTLKPGNAITRAEIAALISRYLSPASDN